MTEIDYSRAVIQVKRVSRFTSLSAIAARKSVDRGVHQPRGGGDRMNQSASACVQVFGRRPPQRVDSLLMPASEKLHKKRHFKTQNNIEPLRRRAKVIPG
jgi:hypothetical protein